MFYLSLSLITYHFSLLRWFDELSVDVAGHGSHCYCNNRWKHRARMKWAQAMGIQQLVSVILADCHAQPGRWHGYRGNHRRTDAAETWPQ